MHLPPALVLTGIVLLSACSAETGSAQEAAVAEVPVATGTAAKYPAAPIDAARRELPGIHNYRRWSQKVAQGAAPVGDPAFAALRAEGITTVISVDGAVPEVEIAAAHGLTYVHVPIGYDGISPDEQLAITKAVESSSGPVFVHCHHGLHRGPAAAAIARIAADQLPAEIAVAGLKESGCSPTYKGLFRDVLFFKEPDAATLAKVGPLPSAVKPEGIRDAMTHVDTRWDYIKASESAKWALLPEFPDVTPAHEAAMLREFFREAQRLSDAQDKGEQFMAWLRESEEQGAALEKALLAEDIAGANHAYAALKKTCNACHAEWRD